MMEDKKSKVILDVVWLAKFPLASENQENMLSCLGQSEARRYVAMPSLAKQQEYLASRYLLRHALSARFGGGYEKWELEEKPKSAPIVLNAPEPCYASVSHSGDMVAIALDRQVVGVDVERQRAIPKQSEISRRIFTATQCKQLSGAVDSLLFFEFWTAKEALFKAHSQNKAPIAFFQNKGFEDSPFSVQSFIVKGFSMSVATKRPNRVWRPELIDV